MTGASGFLGRALSRALIARGHSVDGLCRTSSKSKLSQGVRPIIGDPLEANSYAMTLRPDYVVAHLVGTPKPAPWKTDSFLEVDLGSVQQLVRAVSESPVAHIVYVSVAHPAPIMRAYVNARRRAESLLREMRTPVTALRPWYVLGPGHQWPALLKPLYSLAEGIPALRDGAQRLGLVTLEQMVAALVYSVETAGEESRVLEVPDIRRSKLH